MVVGAALLAGLLLLVAGPALAQGTLPACPPRSAVPVRVTVEDPPVRIRRPVPAAELRTLAEGDSGLEAADPNLHHLALTLSRVEWRSEITVRSQGVAGGPVCALPAELRLTLLHAEHSIVLAREVPRGGCLAREVLAHERRHAEVNRRTLRDAATALRGAAQRWAVRAEVRAPDVAAAAAALQDDLEAAVEPMLDRLRRAREAGHGAIDTPAEYRRLASVCPEDQRRLRRAIGTR